MKITLHPLSVLAGLALAAIIALVSGASPARTAQMPAPTKAVFVGAIPADWWTYVELQAFQSHAEPTGRRFVVTFCVLSGTTRVTCNGTDCTDRLAAITGGFRENDSRVVFQPGDLIATTGNTSRFWGYLEPVR